MKNGIAAKKIRLGRYPYTYVRTAVMKSLLFKESDYHKMLKMSFDEIAKFLQETNYKKEINDLATQYSGPDLLELALNRSLSYSMKKLAKISQNELRRVVLEYAMRWDIEDLKTIIRGKFTMTDQKLIAASLSAAGTLSMSFLMSLLQKSSIEEILKANGLVDYSSLGPAVKELNEGKSLSAVENTMDKWYYKRLIEFSMLLPKQGVLFRNFLIREIEVLDLLTIFRLKKVQYKKEAINFFLINPEGRIARLAEAENIEEAAKLLEGTSYKDMVEKGMREFRENNSLITLEAGLYKNLLRDASLLLHQHPLSVDVILGYMLAKDIEVRNLRLLIKGKQLGLGEEFIEKQLAY